MSGCHVPETATEIIEKSQALANISVLEWEYAQNKFTNLVNIISELSFKINKIQSDLRQFEKQRVDPICERLIELETSARKEKDEVHKILDHHTEQLVDFKCRLDSLEEGEDW